MVAPSLEPVKKNPASAFHMLLDEVPGVLRALVSTTWSPVSRASSRNRAYTSMLCSADLNPSRPGVSPNSYPPSPVVEYALSWIQVPIFTRPSR